MSNEAVIRRVIERFPFRGYMVPGGRIQQAYLDIADTVQRHLQSGSRILDFGCGPCDKTAILQALGFRCSGYDDLQDDWHRIPGNREKILAFAQECGIDFRLGEPGALPFPKAEFDMVMLHDVLEHLHCPPRDLLNDLLELAKPGGLLFVTVPNAVNLKKRLDVLFGRTNLHRFDVYYWYPCPIWRGHIREYVKADLVKLSGYLNLDVLELRACDHMVERLPGGLRLIWLLTTGVLRSGKDSWLLVARKPQDWEPRRSLPQEELTRVLSPSTTYIYD